MSSGPKFQISGCCAISISGGLLSRVECDDVRRVAVTWVVSRCNTYPALCFCKDPRGNSLKFIFLRTFGLESGIGSQAIGDRSNAGSYYQQLLALGWSPEKIHLFGQGPAISRTRPRPNSLDQMAQ
jgi:hypothetical protein